MWTRSELKFRAKEVLQAHRWAIVAVCFIWMIVNSIGSSSSSSSSLNETNNAAMGQNNYMQQFDLSNPMNKVLLSVMVFAMIFSLLLTIFIKGPFEVGVEKFFLSAREDDAEVRYIGYGFTNNYIRNVATMFFRNLYVFLWSLLFIVPGIIKGYEYRMIPYILAENPDITREQAFQLSKKMMDGEKWNAFILDLSFILWWIGSIFTCFILAIFHVIPYVYCTNAELYVELKNNLVANDSEAAQLLGYSKEEVIY